MPEIRIFLKRDEIRGKCWACGNICKLDEKHKLANHIKNFPPKYDETANKSMAGDADKVEKKKEESRKMDKQTKENISNSIYLIFFKLSLFFFLFELIVKLQEIIWKRFLKHLRKILL